MHRLFDADSKGFLTEDEVGALLEVLSDVTDRLGLLPLASQHEIDSMTVEAMTTEDGEYRCVCGASTAVLGRCRSTACVDGHPHPRMFR